MKPFHVLEVLDLAPNGVVAEKFKLTLDDNEIKGVQSYELTRAVGEIAVLTLKLHVALKVGAPADVIEVAGPMPDGDAGALEEAFKNPKPPTAADVFGSHPSLCDECGAFVKRAWFGFGKVIGCTKPSCREYHGYRKGGPIRGKGWCSLGATTHNVMSKSTHGCPGCRSIEA